MAKLIKFDLIIDGNKVKTFEELQDNLHADLLPYLKSGKLAKWFASRDMADQATAIAVIDLNQSDLALLSAVCVVLELEADEEILQELLDAAQKLAAATPVASTNDTDSNIEAETSESTTTSYREDWSGRDLSGRSFKGDDLSHYNFAGANLSKCDFSEANLEGANFEGANLSSTQFVESNLNSANFNEAAIVKCNFEKATLSNACFIKANLSNSTFKQVVMQSADLSHSFAADELGLDGDFTASIFECCKYHRVVFSSSLCLDKCSFKEVDMGVLLPFDYYSFSSSAEQADFSFANLRVTAYGPYERVANFWQGVKATGSKGINK